VTPTVTFPDVEALLTGALPSLLAARGFTVPVGTKVPNPRPARFVRLVVASGNRRNLVAAAPTVTIEGWAQTETDAWALTEAARCCVESLSGQVVGGVPVIRSHDFPLPDKFIDLDTGQPRYTTTGSFVVRGIAFI
jgi:hypothetical protein